MGKSILKPECLPINFKGCYSQLKGNLLKKCIKAGIIADLFSRKKCSKAGMIADLFSKKKWGPIGD